MTYTDQSTDADEEIVEDEQTPAERPTDTVLEQEEKTPVPAYINKASWKLSRYIAEPKKDDTATVQNKINKKKALTCLNGVKLKIGDITEKNWQIRFPKTKTPNDGKQFGEGYNQYSLEGDSDIVSGLKQEFLRNNAENLMPAKRLEQQEISDLWEAILFFYLSKLLNNEVAVFLGSDWDDYVNKIDVLIQKNNTDKFLSADAATGHDLEQKLNYIKQLYKYDKRLNYLKYHLDEKGEIKFRKVPHLILGLSKNKIPDITTEWLATGEIAPQYQKALLLELHMQLTAYAQHFESIEAGSEKAQTFKDFIPTVERALAKLPADTPVPEDTTYEQILQFVKTQFSVSPPKGIDYNVTYNVTVIKKNQQAPEKLKLDPKRSIKVIKKQDDKSKGASA